MLIPLRDNDADGVQINYDHALKLFQRQRTEAARAEAAAGWERYRETDRPLAAQYQLLYAEALKNAGENAEVLRVLASYPDTGPSEGVVQRYVMEARALASLGQPASAEQTLTKAEALCKKADLTACSGVTFTRGSIALLARQTLGEGQLEKARRYYLQAYQFAHSHHDPWQESRASAYLGYIGLQTEHLNEALDWSQISYQIASQHSYEGIAGTATGNLGFAWFQLGDGERALERFQEAEKNAERLGDEDDEFRWLSDTSYVYRDRGELSRAEELQQKALGLARATKDQGQIVNALGDLTAVEISNGDLTAADGHLVEALRIETAGGQKPRPFFALMQGDLAAARHEYARAEGLFQAVLSDKASPIAVRLNAGNDLGRVYEDEKKYAAAEREYRETISAWEAARAALKREESALSFGTNARGVYGNYVRFLVERGRNAEALALADNSRARTLAEGLGFGQNHAAAGAGSATEVLHPEQIARKTGATLLFYWLGDKDSYLWAVGPERTAFSTLPANQQITTWVTRYNKAILDSGDPAEAANADGVALYAALIAPALKVMDTHKPVIVLADGVLNQMNFETLLAPNAAAGEKQTSGPKSREVSAGLIAGAKVPAYPSSRGNVGAEGPAYQRGAAAGTQHYLVEDYTLESAPSLDLLAHGGTGPDRKGLDGKGQTKGNPATNNLLLMGNAAAADADFPPLPLFGMEMTRIAGRFQPEETTVFTGAKATPAAYEAANPEKFAYIHFVSHATASETSPLDSAIILSNPAGANSGASSSGGVSAYKLYAREIVTHKLNARLVTISACYGTGTRAYAGEGLVGLSWAFLRAGSRQVVAALWEVTDESTPRLMDGLYAGIAAGEKPIDALREAKLAMLHSGTRFKEPFYWAPFQIYSRE
ncbi:CHAT domain-containing tetratricopeptide repeat protein [Terracidiphilus gabretensis]|uniref:CHAT domain-containing tetratricopeptide repeat protein n=1 Tax=Terracidiphilus gabretensis TaxID=1577687 RepID=UPI00071B5D27|nr:CHAT domain-containing protein [Terracidiphilus gabretensis]